MYSSSDFERLFIRYTIEVVPAGESISAFCNRNKVPYNLFEKWYKDTRHRIVPVQVEWRCMDQNFSVIHGTARYIWCLVNKSEKIVIYCYEDASRGREALRRILGNHAIKALHSDVYNVYMYLNDNRIDIEHICCMAHARAKFKYALVQGGDIDAAFFLDCIGELYRLETEYEKGRLSLEQIKKCRNNFKTKEIIIRLRSKLDAMLSDVHPLRGELMQNGLRYLNTFWTELFAYTHDRSYTIDNSIAERFIRPLAGERKNSLFFGSEKMACVSAAYHTIISTCKMQGIPVLQYLKEFFKQISGVQIMKNIMQTKTEANLFGLC